MFHQRHCALAFLSLLALPLACSDGESSGGELAPPTLRIETIQNASGESFEKGEAILATCDGRLTVLLGPSELAGFLDDWNLRPPGTCGSLPQCGTIQLTVFEEDVILAEISRASLAVVVDLAPEVLENATDFRVELIEDGTGAPFLVAGAKVADQWPVQIRATEDCPQPNGMGGSGGQSEAPGEGGAEATGGFGGA